MPDSSVPKRLGRFRSLSEKSYDSALGLEASQVHRLRQSIEHFEFVTQVTSIFDDPIWSFHKFFSLQRSPTAKLFQPAPEQALLFEGIMGQLNDHPLNYLFANASLSDSWFWKDSHTQVLCKAKTHLYHHSGMIFEFALVKDASPLGATQFLRKKPFILHAALTHDGVEQIQQQSLSYIVVFLETKPPHGIGFYVLGKETLRQGQEAYQHLFKEHQNYLSEPQGYQGFKGYQKQLLTLELY